MSEGWRPLRRDDAAALRVLARACDDAFGTDEARFADAFERMGDPESESGLAFEDAGGLAAAGWVEWMPGSEPRALLRSFAHPDARALEPALLRQLHARASSLLRWHSGVGWIRADRVLRGGATALPGDTLDAYTELGLEFLYIEHEMRRPLDAPLPDVGLPDISVETWTVERDPAIRDAYNDAFSTRGFGGYSVEQWREYTFSAQEGFRPALSFLAVAGEEVAGFCLCIVDDDAPATGWIDTLGVRPSRRRHGIGDVLLLRVLSAMRAAGLHECALRVNDDNTGARRLYERVGFAPARKHLVYRQRTVNRP